ncbi:MAG: type II toxin-antitoxin system VapC family toxin [Terriglobales bacterium]
MSRIFWDTNIFIYLLEGEGEQAARARDLRRAMLRRGDQLLTSALTLAEVSVKPLEQGAEALSERYQQTIQRTATVLPFEAGHARRFARIRQRRAVRPPDAIQLACAGAAGVDLFVTADERLQGKQFDGIQFIVPLARVPL